MSVPTNLDDAPRRTAPVPHEDPAADRARALLARVRVVLVEPQQPRNVGATARVMGNFGVGELATVGRKRLHERSPARWMAAGSGALLATTRVAATLDDAVADCTFVVGTSARTSAWRDVRVVGPEAAAEAIVAHAATGATPALVFGREDKGLTNDELGRCGLLVRIPTLGERSALNLSQAVGLLCWELHNAARGPTFVPELPPESNERPATAAAVAVLVRHTLDVFWRTGFLREVGNELLMARLRQLAQRAALSKWEISALHGALHRVEVCLDRPELQRRTARPDE